MAKSAAKIATAERRPAQDGRQHEAPGVVIKTLPPAQRLALRVGEKSVPSLSRALGLSLPKKPKTSTIKGGRMALWLGPDEWLVIDEAGGDPLADCASVKALHSAVGVSHRNVAISVSGPAAAATINGGCPQDLSLSAFPVGACSRTILGKSEIVLLRTGPESFRVECWRSFSDYVWAFLTEASRSAAA
ncbi:sarcosine oxidase subunit gamma family protein [Mesorhizobium sp. NBSH29]|uniref:sarcosine oxidase subunit gamma n=1 Tax=Mesorhizobium sp. NBSH29 TaxID=2654249 RepID=UPI0018964B97|nr:sarcosine oxidase subunit gamma [Mesorhizobium sp. NBSH29]QPC85509.1 sarcosine oxidase subunit gamma family protein [Mesorhizobium sp. NBSH29]